MLALVPDWVTPAPVPAQLPVVRQKLAEDELTSGMVIVIAWVGAATATLTSNVPPSKRIGVSYPEPILKAYSSAEEAVIFWTLMPYKISPASLLELVLGLINRPVKVWSVASKVNFGVIVVPVAVADAPEGEKVWVKTPAPSARAKLFPAVTVTVVPSSVKFEAVISPVVEVNLVTALAL